MFSLWPLFFLFGICIGSFLNVCISRIPKGLSIVKPRSHCPVCHQLVAWYDNLPLLSFVFLKGCCRSCHTRISWQYPFVELITGILSVLVYFKFGLSLSAGLFLLFLVYPLIVMTFIDLEHQIIPDVLSLSGILTGTLTIVLISTKTLPEALLFSLQGILVGGGILFLMSYTYEKIRGQEGLGGGDIKLMAMLGAFFGWKGALVILLGSSFLGSLIGICYMVYAGKNMKLAIPFGPFISAAAVIYLFVGTDLLQMYLRWIHFI